MNVNGIRDSREGLELGRIQRKGMTALNYAAFYGQEEIMKMLIKRGAGMYVHGISNFHSHEVPFLSSYNYAFECIKYGEMAR